VITIILCYFPELDEYSPGSENAQLLHLLKCLAELTEFILVWCACNVHVMCMYCVMYL